MDQEMFEQDAQFLWADMLDEVRAKGQDDLLAWLERASPSSFDGAVMRLTTKQKWAARNLMGKYREAVEALMGEITMEPVTLEVEVDGADIAPTNQQLQPPPSQKRRYRHHPSPNRRRRHTHATTRARLRPTSPATTMRRSPSPQSPPHPLSALNPAQPPHRPQPP